MIDLHRYETLKSAGVGYGFVVLVCVTVVALGGYCALHIEHAGHVITGMNNHIVYLVCISINHWQEYPLY